VLRAAGETETQDWLQLDEGEIAEGFVSVYFRCNVDLYIRSPIGLRTA
jgi:hypothetical protein